VHDVESDIHRLWRFEHVNVLRGMLATGTPLLLEYQCADCGNRHAADLLTGASAVVTGHMCRWSAGAERLNPDISIVVGATIDTVVEAIHTHALPQWKLDLYRKARVTTLEVGMGITLSPDPPATPYRIWPARYRAGRRPGEAKRLDLRSRLHWYPPRCPGRASRRCAYGPHFVAVTI